VPKDLLQEMVKLPVLIAHYFHHNHMDRHMHFADFITYHYSNQQHHGKDHDNHNNLPFHNHDFNFQQSIFMVAELDIFTTILYNYCIDNCNTKIISRQHFYSSTALSSIWRPPRLA
jgi:hypothetical protein